MPTAPPPSPVTSFDERLTRQVIVLARAINGSRGRWTLYSLAAAIVTVILATAGMQIVLNAWNKPFYDAIERKALPEFLHQLVVFLEIAGVLLVLNVCQTGINQMIRLKLREMATTDLIENWMTQKRAARISRAGQIGVNPDQRIHEDVHHLTDLTTDLSIGLVQASLLLVSFVGVLWSLSRGIVLHFDGRDFIIPGYMIWAALIYAASGSLLSWRVGRPLVRLNTNRYAREADLRVALVRGAEQADGIALGDGEADERRELEGRLSTLLAVMRRIVLATVRLTAITAGYGWLAIVVPIVVAAPGYFGGNLTFGELMMTVGAFNQVQQSLRWFVDNTGPIADWRATLLRVINFRQALLELDRFEAGVDRINRNEDPEGRMVFDDLAIMSFRGRTELSEPHVVISPGERVAFVGKSGAGKSTLFLSIAGLWNWGTGHIGLPPFADMMFLSRTPFIPAGSLRAALTYAGRGEPPTDARLAEVLKRISLGHLAPLLDQTEGWDNELSAAERERLTFAHLLLAPPKWVVCDEAFDMMDDGNRELIVSLFTTELAKSALVSIAGSSGPDGFYSRVVRLVPYPADAQSGAPDAGQPAGPEAPGKARTA